MASTASAIFRSSSSTSASSDPSPEKSSQTPLLAKEVTSPSMIESASTSSLPSTTSSRTPSPVPPSITVVSIFFPPASPTPLELHSALKRPLSINTPFGDNDSSYKNLPSSPEEIPEETPCGPLIPRDRAEVGTELRSDPEAPVGGPGRDQYQGHLSGPSASVSQWGMGLSPVWVGSAVSGFVGGGAAGFRALETILTTGVTALK
ncbi:hypothetical protein GG344DRAFT_77818 [Lentinula edodes]|nr:hypothetical protein GG344DRAFT_77818 [Lentinula edodes]